MKIKMNKEVVNKILGSSAQVGKKIAIGAAEYVAIQLIADAIMTRINEYNVKKANEKMEKS